ncbi:GTPase [Aeromonas salmonicida]|uniref:GTPase n=1 Tax=Aeromonas salmonicida TaxID=645 RepID=UPI003D1DC144
MDNPIKKRYSHLFQEADALLDQHEVTHGKPIVAAWGLMNAGKSYLLNMLTNHIQTECFRTNDIRETSELKQFESDRFIFLDTPGLDANSEDDQIAHRGEKLADVVLFVHQPQGELEKIEIEFLLNLASSFGTYAKQNIILILSKSDKESPEKIGTIERRIQEQCQSELGFIPRSFQISGTRYRAGVTQNKDGLVRASHIQDLVQHLNSFAEITTVKRERKLEALNGLLIKLAQAEDEVSAMKSVTKNELINGFSSFNLAMKEFRQSMESHAAKFRAIQ